MGLLYELDAAGGSILLHPLDKHFGLFCSVLHSLFVLKVEASWQTVVAFLLSIFALSQSFGFDSCNLF